MPAVLSAAGFTVLVMVLSVALLRKLPQAFAKAFAKGFLREGVAAQLWRLANGGSDAAHKAPLPLRLPPPLSL
ncbi:hypothetical protein T492DRAFT_882242 [Pavlovales sp. CCMP2436]|nr:hypothetical protein T492DRAFT_882242 [Pavlovales sp. CCMP2436]